MTECWYEEGECKADCAVSRHGHCYAEKLDTLQVGAQINRRKRSTPQGKSAGSNNAWERGDYQTATGKPLLDARGEPIGTAEYANNRTQFDARRKHLATHPNPFGDPQLPRADGTG